jgi:hypothetical protein
LSHPRLRRSCTGQRGGCGWPQRHHKAFSPQCQCLTQIHSCLFCWSSHPEAPTPFRADSCSLGWSQQTLSSPSPLGCSFTPLLFWFFFLAVLGFEFGASCLLGRHNPHAFSLLPRLRLGICVELEEYEGHWVVTTEHFSRQGALGTPLQSCSHKSRSPLCPSPPRHHTHTSALCPPHCWHFLTTFVAYYPMKQLPTVCWHSPLTSCWPFFSVIQMHFLASLSCPSPVPDTLKTQFPWLSCPASWFQHPLYQQEQVLPPSSASGPDVTGDGPGV